jgi:glycosyltransferase involved in cell wall biosynthesis
MKRAAVYNRFWHSQGGGERHAGMIAQVLSIDPAVQVELVGHTPVDLAELGDHLGLDLSRCHYRLLPDRGDAVLARRSAEYDLWVTGSYMSRLVPQSTRSAYLCFFPTPFDHDLSRWRKRATRIIGPLLRGHEGAIGAGEGWFPAEGGHRRRWMWSSGSASIIIPPGEHFRVGADFGRPGAPGPVTLTLSDGAKFTKTLTVTPEFRRERIVLPPAPEGLELHLQSDTFQPGGSDVRSLGVAVSRLRVQGVHSSPRRVVANRFPWLQVDPANLEFLNAYDTVLANSEYTRGWIEKLWSRGADVLFPPIAVERLQPAEQREKVILSVGRFFSPGLGHAKRQLDMVQWFGALHRAGRLPDWRMHVVGGCEDSQVPYLAQIQRAAEGLPVTITPNAERSLVTELLCTSSVFWSATGWGESPDAPWAAEHFGMTTVEAMAGGCVPVVIDLAGQREIVREGVDGFRWSSIEQLGDATVRVAQDPALRSRLAASAVGRASGFSEHAFAERWHAIATGRRLLDG